MDEFEKKIKQLIVDDNLYLQFTDDYISKHLDYLELMFKKNPNLFLNIKYINYAYNNATDLKWLQYFPNISTLSCTKNKLTSESLADLRFVPNLTALYIDNNRIKDLSNIQYVPRLLELKCSSNYLRSLPPINPNIEALYCFNNRIKQITFTDSSDIFKIKILFCSDNELTLLDVSKCVLLEQMNCRYNYIEKLDVQNLIKLQKLICGHNHITTITGINDLSLLKYLDCRENNLASLNISSLDLTYLNCSYNRLTKIEGLEKQSWLVYLNYDKACKACTNGKICGDYKNCEVCKVCMRIA